MRKQALAVLVTLAVLAGTAAATSVTVDFEDNPLAPNSHYNGQDQPNIPGGFVSGDVSFPNAFYDNGTFTWWEGTALSNETDTTTPGFTNQFSVWAGSAYSGSNFAIANGSVTHVELPVATTVEQVYLTNTTYAALSMRDGDFFNDPFGGDDGNEEDWFMVTITGYDSSDTATGSVDFYLADYRFADNTQDYIVDTWEAVDLTPLGSNVRTLKFSWDSSDVGPYGINTPAYVAFDNLTVAAVPEPAGLLMLGLGLLLRRR